MILRLIILVALVVSMALPVLAKPLNAARCPSQTSLELCYGPHHAAQLPSQSNLENPCAAKALPCADAVQLSADQNARLLVAEERQFAWISQISGPPEKPPRI